MNRSSSLGTKTGDRRVLSYLVKPLSDQITRAFRVQYILFGAVPIVLINVSESESEQYWFKTGVWRATLIQKARRLDSILALAAHVAD